MSRRSPAVAVLISLFTLLALWLPADLRAQTAPTPLPAGITAGPTAEGISEFRLANGLKVLLFPDQSKDLTLVNVTYLVGSKHENYGETGMAHLLEHLVFKGTPTHADPTKEFTARGMRWNGNTTHERTVYFEAFTANDDNLRFALKFEADRMVNSFIAKKDLDSEMTVVRNEYERGENEPFRVLVQRLGAAVFTAHNYGKPTIGVRSDIENVNIERLQAFYKRYYQPDNAVLLIAGKFDPARTLGWVAESFGAIVRPSRVLPALYTAEPTQDGERDVTVRRVGDIKIAAVGYRVPVRLHADSLALSLLGATLTSNPSGPLYKTFVESKKATQIGPIALGGVDAGFAGFVLVADKSSDLARLETELIAALEGSAVNGVDQEGLQRAQREMAVAFEKAAESPITLAMALSEAIPLGDWRLLFAQRDRAQQVTLADLRRVQKTYFKAANRSIARFMPEATPDRVELAVAPSPESIVATYKPRAALADGEAFIPTPDALERRTVRDRANPALQSAVLRKQNRGDSVVVKIQLRWGERREQVAQPALGFVGQLLMEGESPEKKQARTDALTRLKSRYSVGGSPVSQGATISITSDREHVLDAIRLLLPEIRAGKMSADAFARIKKQITTGLASRANEPQTVLNNVALPYKNKAFGLQRGDPEFRQTNAELIADLQEISFEDVQRAWQRNWGASQMQVAVVGTAPEGVVEEVQRQFEGWRSQAPAYVRYEVRHQTLPGNTLTVEVPDKANALLDVDQFLPLNANDADAAALRLAVAVFGGNQLDNRLAERIRKKDGLSYSVDASLSLPEVGNRAYFGVEGSYAPQNRDRVVAALREEAALAIKDGFTEAELSRARSNELQARLQRWSSDDSIASALLTQMDRGESFALDAAREGAIKVATLAEVNAAFRKYIKPDEWLIGLAGDFAKAEKSGTAATK